MYLTDTLKEKIEQANNIAIFTHIHPDGDALGSAYSFKLAMQKSGKRAEVFLNEETTTPAYSIVQGKESSGLKIEDCDLRFALDCGDASRLGDMSEYFNGNTIVIDHHISNSHFGQGGIVLPDAAATGEILYDVYGELGIEIDADMANNLYIAIVSDTGNFKYSCASARTHRIAADLIERGADFAEITKVLFDTKPYEYFKLMRIALDKLSIHCDGKAALLCLKNEDFASAGIGEDGADAIVTIPRTISGVEVGVYIHEREGGEFKVSLRSNRYVNVAKLAEQFGGGGHIRAAGYSVSGLPEQEIKDSILAKIDEIL